MRDGPEVPLAHNVARSKWIALMMTILAVDNKMTPPNDYNTFIKWIKWMMTILGVDSAMTPPMITTPQSG